MLTHFNTAAYFKSLMVAGSLVMLSACGDNTTKNNDGRSIAPPTVAMQTFTPNVGTTEGSSDASTAFALSDDYMIVADDEANVLRVYPRQSGAAVLEWSYEQNGPKLAKELDLEAGTRIGNTLYLTGSMSNKKDGDDAPDRSHLFAVNVSGTGATTQFNYVGEFAALESQLVAWDSGNLHGLGADYFGFATAAGAGVVPEQVTGFSVEGMTTAPDGSALWLAFRAPQVGSSTHTDALIVPVLNYADLVSGQTSQADFGTPIQLNLGARGIRSIDKGTDGNYLIVAGPAGGSSDAVTRNFALFSWDGKASSAPVELDNNLDSLRQSTGGSFESVVAVAGPVATGTSVQLLTDNGDTIWSGKTEVSKDLPDAEQQFQGFTLSLGAPRVDDEAPVLVSSTPADNNDSADADARIILTFNEGIRLGDGQLTVHKANGDIVQSFSTSSSTENINVSFNIITLTPSQPLEANTSYYMTVDANAVMDAYANVYAGIAESDGLNFKTATPTILNTGDILFMGGNADATDAFAFVLLKPVTGGTKITFTDRDRKDGSEFSGIINESAFVWSASSRLAAGTIITVQTDVSGNPVASKGKTQGAGGGVGKAETIFAFTDGQIAGLSDGAAGEITAVGTYLASLTLGGAAGAIPAELTSAGTAFSFVVTPAKQTNALYTGTLDRSDLAVFVARVKDPSNWTANQSGSGWTLTAGSLFAGE